jgi:hypothetical protein
MTMPEARTDDQDRSSARKWIIGGIVAMFALAGLMGYFALEAEEDIKARFQHNLEHVMYSYANCTESLGGPPKTQEEFLKWLAGVQPRTEEDEQLVSSGRVVLTWGAKPAPSGSGSELVFAYTTDPPVRGRRPVGMLDMSIRWMTPEEFDAAPKAEPER